jgi:hypothetical protein
MKMAGWLSQPNIPERINADFHGSAGEIRLPADACRLDQEPAMRAAISPGAALDPAGRHQRRQASRCSSVSQDWALQR